MGDPNVGLQKVGVGFMQSSPHRVWLLLSSFPYLLGFLYFRSHILWHCSLLLIFVFMIDGYNM